MLDSPGAPKAISFPIHKQCKNKKTHCTTNKNTYLSLKFKFPIHSEKKHELLQLTLFFVLKHGLIVTHLHLNISQQISITSIELIDHLVKTTKAFGEYYLQLQKNL